MKTTIQTLDLIRRNNGHCSDYRAAKLMGVTRSMVSAWRNEKRTMSTEQRIKAAALIDESPDEHVIFGQIERAKNTAAKHVWQHALKRLSATAAALVLTVGLVLSTAEVQSQINNKFDGLYIMRINCIELLVYQLYKDCLQIIDKLRMASHGIQR